MQLSDAQVKQVREALAGALDQPETAEAYGAMMDRLQAALAALDAKGAGEGMDLRVREYLRWAVPSSDGHQLVRALWQALSTDTPTQEGK